MSKEVEEILHHSKFDARHSKPLSRLIVVPHAEHMVMLEKHKVINQAILNFIPSNT